MFSFLALSEAYQLSTLHWVIALFTACLIGFSKAGIKGISIIIVTLMALIFGGKASTGIILPLFIFADIFAVIYYHRHTQWKYLLKLLPWMIIGVVLGAKIGKHLDETIFKQGMAIIILISVIIMYLWDKRKSDQVPNNIWFAGTIGLIAGFSTMIGNLAGAFSNIFFLAMRLPKDQFIGTAAWLFFIINIFKLPFHIFSWETITMESFAVNLRLYPAILVGLFIGIRLVKLIKNHQYRQFILAVTAIGAILIFFR